MKKLIIVFVLVLSGVSAYAQERNFISRYWNSLVNDTSDASRPQFLVYPTVAYSPETSWEFGLSSLYVYYARQDTANRLSEISGFSFFTLENQYGLWFDHALYSDKSEWFYLGRLRVQSFPLLFFGIGPESPSEFLAQVNGNQIQIRERVLRKVYENLYLGVQADFHSLSSVEFINKPSILYELPPGSQGSSNLGAGLGLVYDNRHNVLNVREGIFSELAFLRYAQTLGSDFSFTTFISDNRIYRSVNSRDVLAAQVLGQFTIGSPPFNQLALMGGESIMRGYYLGRFRDRNQLASQLEYRFLPLPLSFTNRLGAALFAGSGAVFDQLKNFSGKDMVWSAGGGLRFLMFPKKDVYTRLDFAFTEEGKGFYIYIGEAF